MVLAFLALYCNKLGYTIQQSGMVVGVYGLGSIVGALMGGKLSDKYGFYKMQFLALFCGGILFIVLGQMHTYLLICVFTFILAMVNESFRPANATAIAHYSTPENRTQSFSLVRLAINLGWGVGGALGGFLASIDYKWLFWVDGTTNIVAAFLLLLVLPKVSLSQQRAIIKKDNNSALSKAPSKDKVFMAFLFLQVLFSFAFFQLFTTVPLYFKNGLHLGEHSIGIIMACNGILIALLEMLIVYKLEGRFRYLSLMTVGSVLMGLSFLMLNLPLANGLIVGILSMLVITIAEMVSMPFMNSFYIARTNEQNRGRYAGLYTMSWSIAQVAGSTTGSFIANKIGFFSLWVCIFAMCILVAFGYWWLIGYKKRYDSAHK